MRFVQIILLMVSVMCIANAARAVPPLTAADAIACRNRARDTVEQCEELISRHAYNSVYMRGDFAPMKAAYAAAAEAWGIAADAIDVGDASAPVLRVNAEKADLACGIWRERLEVREWQATIAPQEGNHNQLYHNTGSSGREALNVLTGARRTAAEAWGLVAEATLPGQNPETLADLKEKALQAADEVELANVVFNATDHRDQFRRKGDVNAPQLTTTIEELRQLDDERAALQRDKIVLAAKMRALDRRRAALEEKAKQAHDAVKKK